MHTVTVVVPTRNRLATLQTTLAAVLGQRGPQVRAVVVDEGSSDGTPAWLAAVTDPRVTVIRHDEPKGLPGARNAGIAAARTKYVAFCDDDDLWAPNKLAAELDALRADPSARWACTGTVSVDMDLQITGHQRPPTPGAVHDALKIRNVVPAGGSTVLAERALLREAGCFDPTMTRCEDYHAWIRLAELSPIACVDAPLVAYRVWPGTLSSSIAEMRRGHEAVVAPFRAELDNGQRRFSDLDKEIYLGRFYLRAGDRVGALQHYLRAAVTCRAPRQALHGLAAFVLPGATAAWRDRQERREVPSA